MKIGVIQVVKYSDDTCWYKDCIGKFFYVIQFKSQHVLWFSPFLFFLPQDVMVIEEESDEALVPQYTYGVA